jgi:hypothetical protein
MSRAGLGWREISNLGQLKKRRRPLRPRQPGAAEALALNSERGPFGMAVNRHSLALVSLRAGRPAKARLLLSGLSGYLSNSGNTDVLINTLEPAAAITVGLNDSLRAVRLAGAADAVRQESGMLITDRGGRRAGGVPRAGPCHYRT